MIRKEDRYTKVVEYFSIHQPVAETELQYSNPFHLLVATILSAQCTDKRVNIVTPALFTAYPSSAKLAEAEIVDVYEYIKSVSYPNNKARHLVEMAKMLVADFNGQVPSEVDDLQKLPGVGRKTANVIASVIFNKPVMAVDTHVFRVASRIGLTSKSRNPLETEKQLMKHIPTNKVAIAHHWLILHGRYVCTARNPKCVTCGIKEMCKYYESFKDIDL